MHVMTPKKGTYIQQEIGVFQCLLTAIKRSTPLQRTTSRREHRSTTECTHCHSTSSTNAVPQINQQNVHIGQLIYLHATFMIQSTARTQLTCKQGTRSSYRAICRCTAEDKLDRVGILNWNIRTENSSDQFKRSPVPLCETCASMADAGGSPHQQGSPSI